MAADKSALSRTFTLAGQLRFAFPRMMMSLFIMSYMVADGVLISRYMGTAALASLNMIFPLAILLGSVGIMLSAGGASVVSRRLGAGERDAADRAFSTLVYAEAVFGFAVGLAGVAVLPVLLDWLQVTSEQYAYARDYQIVWFLFMSCHLVSVLVLTFFTVAGRPKLGLLVSAASGITGGALATVLSWIVAVAAGVVFFRRSDAGLRLVLTRPDWRALKGACTSGFSEMVSNLSFAVTLYFFNSAFVERLGVDGVAALTVASYSTYVFNSVFYGFCEATSPILGYKYGEQNWKELAQVFGNSVRIAAVFSLAAYILSLLFARPVLGFFAPEDSAVYRLVLENFRWFAVSLLLLLPNMFAAYLFTAVGDGKRAAVVSFCRTFLFSILCIEGLPLLLGDIGLWLAVPMAELLTLVLSTVLVLTNRRRYGFDGRPALVIRKA